MLLPDILTGSGVALRVSVVHNLPAPYRLPLFESLLTEPSLDVRIYFTGSRSKRRTHWNLGRLTSDPRVKLISGIGIKVHGTGSDEVRVNPGLLQVFENKPDLILLYGYEDLTNVLLSVMCVLRRIPYVLFAEVSPVMHDTLIGTISTPLISWVVRHATHLVPASESAASFFEIQGGQRKRMTMIPCIPDTSGLMKKSETLSRRSMLIREEMGLTDSLVVLYVGRLVEYKGIRELLGAAEIMESVESDIVFLVVGTGPLEPLVVEKGSSSSGRIRYMGSLSDEAVWSLMSIADIQIMPSWYEAFGVVALEALSFGVPVIVTSMCGCINHVKDGFNGYIIPPRDQSAIARAVLKASRNKSHLKEMSVNARQSVLGVNHDTAYRLLMRVITSSVGPR